MKKTFVFFVLASLLFWNALATAQTPTPQAVPTKQATPRTKPPVKETERVNINYLNYAQLIALGLSDASAKNVIRERPFQRISELMKQNIVTAKEFWVIEKKVYAWSTKRGF